MCARSALFFLHQGEQLLSAMKPNSVNFLYYYIAPCTVELAFSCELYLKAIIATENNNYIKPGHYLKALFNQLSKEAQIQVEKKYSAYESAHPECKAFMPLKKCLKKHSNAFIEWRYYFEIGKHPSVEPSSLYYLALSLHDIYQEVSENAD